MKIPIIESFGISDVGTIRANNEDIIAYLPSHHFFAIADGMGGHKAGEIAAKEATERVTQYNRAMAEIAQKQKAVKNQKS